MFGLDGSILGLHISNDQICGERQQARPFTTTNAVPAPILSRPFLPAHGSTESERSVTLAEIRGMRESWLDSRMTEKSAGLMNLGFHQSHGGAIWYNMRESWVRKYMMTSLESMWLSNQPKLIFVKASFLSTSNSSNDNRSMSDASHETIDASDDPKRNASRHC
jgi:hypothetical protein